MLDDAMARKLVEDLLSSYRECYFATYYKFTSRVMRVYQPSFIYGIYCSNIYMRKNNEEMLLAEGENMQGIAASVYATLRDGGWLESELPNRKKILVKSSDDAVAKFMINYELLGDVDV